MRGAQDARERPLRDIRTFPCKAGVRTLRVRIHPPKMAEREGFEPPDPCESVVFKTTALNRSATSPLLTTYRSPPSLERQPGSNPYMGVATLSPAFNQRAVLVHGSFRV